MFFPATWPGLFGMASPAPEGHTCSTRREVHVHDAHIKKMRSSKVAYNNN